MPASHEMDEAYRLNGDGIFALEDRPRHRDDEYDPAGFSSLLTMQERHFWYQGRHRFLLAALRRELRRRPPAQRPAAVDLGGGCGGWLEYLKRRSEQSFGELALADSSRRALELAGPVVGPAVERYQVDLVDLRWRERWDVAFLLDVLEHIPQHREVMRQVAAALRPGGVLLVTAPALDVFRTYNDDLVHHVRRYSRRDLAGLAVDCDLDLEFSRYFMFFLSPALLASRLRRPPLRAMTAAEIDAHLKAAHRIPPEPINRLLTLVFACETPLGLWVPFPWGTSVLGVFRKPAS